MNAAAELGRNPVSKHQIQPEYGDEQGEILVSKHQIQPEYGEEQADAGRGG